MRLFRDDKIVVRTTGLAGARRERKAQGKARATIGKELSISNFTQLRYAFPHSPTLFTTLLPCKYNSTWNWPALLCICKSVSLQVLLVKSTNVRLSILSETVGKQVEHP